MYKFLKAGQYHTNAAKPTKKTGFPGSFTSKFIKNILQFSWKIFIQSYKNQAKIDHIGCCACILDIGCCACILKTNNFLLFGKMKVRKLSDKWSRYKSWNPSVFRQKADPEKMEHLKHTLNTIPISSSECEWRFLQMNLNVSQTRAVLMTKILVIFVY